MLIAESTIFPCPPAPTSTRVSDVKAYWHRLTIGGIAIVRLMRDPVLLTGPDGDPLVRYEEIEVRIPQEEVVDLAGTFDVVWSANAPDGNPLENPVEI